MTKRKRPSKTLAVVRKPEGRKQEEDSRYKPHPVDNIKCQFCSELLIKVYPYAWIENPVGQTKVFCMKCKHAKVNNLKK